jgi:Zinc finger C-x8-C-x5-C-x3-H type (and similar)
MECYSGQVLHIRSSSKQVIWMHLELTSNVAKKDYTGSARRIEVICKEEESPEVNQYVRYVVKVGDKVSLTGWFEESKALFHGMTCAVTEKYSDVNLSPFRPIPSKQKNLDAQSVKSTVCKYFVNTGVCIYGDKCNFLHPSSGEELKNARDTWKLARRQGRDSLIDPCDPHAGSKSSHGKRAVIFAQGLADSCSDFSQVFDIAGGRGEISIELFITKRISTILIDPRDDCLRPSKKQMKELSKLNLKPTCTHIKSYFPGDLVDASQGISLMQSSLIFGMHPDQATEPIVDFAVKHNISFAIVPCCVFARESPDRMLDGKPVVSYEDFVAYLMAKDSRIQKSFLTFDGRNQCLYMRVN